MWKALNAKADIQMLGFLPQIISANSPLPVHTQIELGYGHGGGYSPMDGWTFNPETKEITYPGDPAYKPQFELKVKDETVIVYRYAWVLILQPDGTFAVTRMD